MTDETDASTERSAPSFTEGVRVVGVGASAGGLQSLEQFFGALPADPGMAFVVVQHLSPDFRSMMSELLSRHCRMPVTPIEHGVVIERDRVYLLPPKKELTIEDGRLLLNDKDPQHALNLPIDLFFRSLAKDAGPLGVAVVLSGSGSDGSRGLRDVKSAGGLVLVETAESAKFDGMPLSAQATGLVDVSAPPATLARYLLGEDVADGEAAEEELPPADETPMEAALRLLRRRFGLDFGGYKTSTVERRILRRVSLGGGGSLEDYVERLQGDPEELEALYHDLLIGVTRFFRDPEAFDVLQKEALPRLLQQVSPSEELRVWVAGCATGEEAYSLAILLIEELTARDRPTDFKILATDVHRASLERASIGLYADEQLEHVSKKRRQRFFVKRPGGYQTTQELRQHIVFAPHNVTQDAPFTRMHLVTCRNLLIYLEPEAQRTVLSLFHFGLATSGLLFLGASESPGPFAHEFDAVDTHSKIFRKRRDVRLLDPLKLPIARKGTAASPPFAPPRHAVGHHLLPIYDQLLDEYMPPGLLVDDDRALVDSFGGAERFLHFARRRPSTNVLDILEGELRTVVGSAIQRALASSTPVRYSGVPLPDEGSTRRVSVVAKAVVNPRGGQRHVLVTFESPVVAPSSPPSQETVTPATATPTDELAGSQASDERMRMLEAELAYARETLQAAVEEQQTSNEELQATNEELVASNEELQSTNEELHSVNEELYTVNDEYQKKIDELSEANNDIQHLLESADYGTLFLDRELRVRKFTPRIASLFHLRPEDVGRPIADFWHDLDRPALLDELRRTLADGSVIEDEVRDDRGTTFFMRVLPYRPAPVQEREAGQRKSARPAPSSLPPQGVMLSLTDISALERARARIHQLSAIVESSDDAIISKDLDGIVKSWNGGAERLYGYTAQEALGRKIHFLAPAERQGEIDEFLATIRAGGCVEHVETVRVCKDGTELDVSVTISPIHDAAGELVGASAIARDFTALKRVQRTLEQREERIRLLLDSTAEAIYGLGTDGTCTFANPACAQLLGFDDPDELIGHRMHELVHHTRDDGTPYPESECPIYAVLRTGELAHSSEGLFHKHDGSGFHVEYWSHPILNEGRLEGAVVTFLDISQRRENEEEIRLGAKRREQFLAMLSHELRNPLAAVLNATALMQAQPLDNPILEKARGVIERQGRHMTRLLDDLLDVSRITRGGIELRKALLDLRTPLELAVEASTARLGPDDARVVLDLPDAPLAVRGDATRLQQVFSNLLTNALRHSERGGRVFVTARPDGGSVLVAVRDEGEGIAPELLPDIFDLFVQGHQDLARTEGGLGVGLALVRQLAELHGGRVEARSDGPGEGSEFLVTLPLQVGAALDGGTADREPGEVKPRRVVVVEDQDDAREMMRILLEAKGCVVFEARDGAEAVELVSRVRPDVALVDIGLPVLDGFGVARKLREDRTLDDVTLVALTGYGSGEDVAAAREAGFTRHVTKPAAPGEIDEILAG